LYSLLSVLFSHFVAKNFYRHRFGFGNLYHYLRYRECSCDPSTCFHICFSLVVCSKFKLSIDITPLVRTSIGVYYTFSLVSGGQYIETPQVKYHSNIHVLVVGDSPQVKRVLKYAVTLKERYSIHNSNSKFVPKLSVDEDGYTITEEGPLISACYGMFLIPELQWLSKSSMQILANVMDTQSITVEKENIRCSIPLNLSVVANLMPQLKKGTANPISSIDQKLLQQFDVVFSTDDTENVESIYSALNSEHIFHSDTRVLLSFDVKKHVEIEQLISRCSTIEPKFSLDAHLLLKRFFVSVRQIRPIECHQNFFLSLVRIASSHAKLAMHLEVNVSDSLVAIELIEESMLRKTGASVLGWKLLKAKRNIELYGTTTSDQYSNFYKHVTQFISLHSLKHEE